MEDFKNICNQFLIKDFNNEEVKQDHEEQEVEHPDIEEEYQQEAGSDNPNKHEDEYCPDDHGGNCYDEDNFDLGGDTYDSGGTEYD